MLPMGWVHALILYQSLTWVLFLHMPFTRECRPRKLKYLTQICTAAKWQSGALELA